MKYRPRYSKGTENLQQERDAPTCEREGRRERERNKCLPSARKRTTCLERKWTKEIMKEEVKGNAYRTQDLPGSRKEGDYLEGERDDQISRERCNGNDNLLRAKKLTTYFGDTERVHLPVRNDERGDK